MVHRPVRKRTQTITIIRPAGTVAPPSAIAPPAEITPQPVPVSPDSYVQTVATPPSWFLQPHIPVAPNFPDSTTSIAIMQTESSPPLEAFHMLTPVGQGMRPRGCPPLPAEAGVQVRCYFAKLGKVFNCNKMRSPISTEATYTYAISFFFVYEDVREVSSNNISASLDVPNIGQVLESAQNPRQECARKMDNGPRRIVTGGAV